MPTLTTSFTAFANRARSGSVASWQSPANAQASDDVRASTTTVTTNGSTDYIAATNLADKLPAGATITGIKVTVEHRDASGSAQDLDAKLIVGGTLQGFLPIAVSSWPTSDGTASYGGAGDTWGLSLTAAQVNAADFGFALAVSVSTGSVIFNPNPEGV